MAIPLKYNTASQEVPLGYFLDSTDGNTEETGLTIANTDIKLWKSGATTLANKNSGGATHISNGIYYCVLDATDTNTYGPLVIFVHVSGALAIRVECVVMEADAYDALYASAGTGHLEADAVQISGDSTAADNLKLAFDGTGYGFTNCTIPTCTTNTDMRGTDNAALASVVGALADAAATGEVTSADTLMQYIKQLINILVGTPGIGTFPAEAAPGDGVSLAEVIRAIHADVTGLNGDAMRGTDGANTTTPPTAAAIADQVWDEAKSGHVGAGSFGEEVQAHSLSSEIAALNDLSAADVNAECDTALSDYDAPTKAEMDAGHALLATEAKQDIIDTNVDTLVARLTAARAGYLDELDVSTSAKMAWYVAKQQIALVNKKVFTEASGNLEQFNDSDVSIGTIASAVTSDGTYTTQLKAVQ